MAVTRGAQRLAIVEDGKDIAFLGQYALSNRGRPESLKLLLAAVACKGIDDDEDLIRAVRIGDEFFQRSPGLAEAPGIVAIFTLFHQSVTRPIM